MARIEIVIGMAGDGKRFQEAGYAQDKPFIDVQGMPMIRRVIQNLTPISDCFTLVCKFNHVERLEHMLKDMPHLDARVIGIETPTEGAACSVLKIGDKLAPRVPVLITACDQIIEYDVEQWKTHLRDGNYHTSWVFGPASHPKWSYCKLDGDRVVEVKEKEPISSWANCGLYYWNRWDAFVEAAERMIAANRRVNNEFYVAPVLQENIELGQIVRPFFPEKMHGLGTPEDLQSYLSLG